MISEIEYLLKYLQIEILIFYKSKNTKIVMFIKILFVNKSFILIIYYKLNNISNFQILLNTIRLQYFKLLLYSN